MKSKLTYINILLLLTQFHNAYNLSAEQINLSNIVINSDWQSPVEDNLCLSRNNLLNLCDTCSISSPFYSTEHANYIFMNFTFEGRIQTIPREVTFTARTRMEANSQEEQSKSIEFKENATKIVREFRISDISLEFPIAIGHKYMSLSFSTNKQSCSVLGNIQVYYYRLQSKTYNLASFPAASAPIRGEVRDIVGTCSENAVPWENTLPKIMLFSDGSFNKTGECRCNIGHYLEAGKCKACALGEYKEGIGNEHCTVCGNNTLQAEINSCPCINGFYREEGKENVQSEICYAPPSTPVDISLNNITPSSVKISWRLSSLGSNPDGEYEIFCTNCPQQRKQPSVQLTSETEADVSNLEAFGFYTFTIVKKNNISVLIGKIFPGSISFTTMVGAPGAIRSVNTTTLDNEKVFLTWLPPFGRGSPNLIYRIEYDDKIREVNATSYILMPEENTVTYNLQIRAVALIGNTAVPSTSVHSETVRLKGVVFVDTGNGSDGPPAELLGGVAAGVLLFVVLLLTIIIILYRKQKRPKHLQIYRMEDGSVDFCRGQRLDKERIYVDPTTYSQLDYAVYEFTQELQLNQLQIGKILGSGEFAEVFKGVLKKNGQNLDVAIKKLKYDASTRDRDDFISEAAILGQFNDPNVIHLEGVVLKEIPNLIVMELMENGSLDTFLMKNDQKFSVTKLLGMARGVASGMKYLSQLSYIHRDLAARNILVDQQEICKIADFGMSRELKLDETYSTRGGKIPIKWTAPEAIQLKKFTTSSDIWSYGIVLWEIMSYGQRPYWDWPNYEVLERLTTGYRLPPPMGCPKVVHDLMLQCWNKDRARRPLFEDILSHIEGWIKNSVLLSEKEISTITKMDEEMDYSNVMGSLSSWLQAIKMEQYFSLFMQHGYTTPRHILHFTIADLQEIGIVPIGHQKKIFKAIRTTKIQVEGRKRTVSRTSSTLGYAKSALGRKISNFTCSFSVPNGTPILEKTSTLETVIDIV